MAEQKRNKRFNLPVSIDDLKTHDHPCLIYESREERLETVVPFTLSGLKRGEKCIYIIDAGTADEFKIAFKAAGTDIDEYESRGQFSVIHEKDAYTREGFFDPDLMIAQLISENEQALREGYPTLRIVGEMSWALHDYSSVESVLEYEAKLNKNLFSKYPCIALCSYDRWKFDPGIIKEAVMTHPLLIRGGQIYHNFCHIEPEHYLDPEKEEHEVQYLLDNLERERKIWESLQEEKAYSKVIMDNLPIGLAVNTVEPEVDIIYMNENFPNFYHTTRKALSKYDNFWEAVYEDPQFRSKIKEKVLKDFASGDPKKMFWENIPITRNGQIVAYVNASNTPVPDKGLMISTVWDVTARVKAEQALRKSEEEHRHLFETMAQGVIYQDADGKIISANPAAERILGLTLDQMQGKTSMDPHWQMVKEDGTPVTGTEHPTMIALQAGEKVGPVTRAVFHPDKNSHVWLNIIAIPLFQPGEEKPFQVYATFEDITERKQAEEALKRVEWMLDTGKSKNFEEIKNIPAQPYGSLTISDSPGLIQEAVGEEVLTEIAADYLSLLETSTAVYEANGDYAFGIFSSGWCRLLDNASRELCKTDDNDEALRCGKWLCHESCWTDTSQKAIETGQPVDTPCHGGLRLYAVPIWANQEVVGAINFGYGDPPWDRGELKAIADKYQVDINELAEKARAYESRPPFIIELAKDRLHGSAKLIGAIVERKQLEKHLREINESLTFYQLAVNSMDDYKIAVIDENYRYKAVSKQYLEGYSLSKVEIEGKEVADLVGQETFEQAIKPHLDRALKGEVVTYQDWFEIPTRGQRFTEVNYYPIFGENENVYAVAAITHDITDLKLAEEEKQETYKRLKALLDNSPSQIIIFDENGTYMEVSRAAAKIIGLSVEEICGKTFHDLLPKETADKFMGTVNQLKNEQCLINKVDLLWVDGEERVFESRLFPISTINSRTDLFGSIVIDITERKQAEEALQKRLSELEILTYISSTIRTAETLDEMLSMLLDEILKTFDTDTGAIWLNYPSPDILNIIKARGWVETLAEEDFMPDQEEGIIGQVFRTREPYASGDIAADPLLKPVAGARIPEGWSGIFVPLLIENEPVGILFVSMKLPRIIKSEEHNLMVLLADIAGTAIHRLNLYEKTLRQLYWLEATNAVDLSISSSQDLRLTLDILINHIITQTEANAACLYLYDNATKNLSYADGRGFKSKNIKTLKFKLGESCPGKTALERQMCKCRIEDVEAARDKVWTSILKAENFTVSICIPLIAKGEVKGVLSTFHRQPLSEDPRWLNFLEALALQAAIAIDNVSLFESLQRSNQELEAAYNNTIEGWGQAMELRDHETNGHTRRVADTTIKMARAMGVEEEKLEHIRRGALLHDVGKIGIPDAILFKPGKLTEDEWEVMRGHPVMVYNMLSSIEYLRPALNIPYCHHEKYDGSGYPQGLKGDQIPLEARIFAIIDVYDALTSDRPYRKAWSKEKAIAHIKEQSGKHFDPQVVEVFLKVIDEIKI